MPKKDQKEKEEKDKEHIVRNFDYFDSDDDLEEGVIEELDNYDGYETPDEETEDYLEGLQRMLKDVADVEVIGLKVYKINFHDTRLEDFVDTDTDTDFDLDENGFPIMLDGGEEFIAPYLKMVSDKINYYQGCLFETNVNYKFNL